MLQAELGSTKHTFVKRTCAVHKSRTKTVLQMFVPKLWGPVCRVWSPFIMASLASLVAFNGLVHRHDGPLRMCAGSSVRRTKETVEETELCRVKGVVLNRG